MDNNKLLNELLHSFEESFKKGLLSFWIFLSLKNDKKYVDEIKLFIENNTKNAMTCELQSLYRNLRKYKHLGIVDYEMGQGNKGPDRKYYFLTKFGQEFFDKFVKRNILLFQNPDILDLIKKE